MIRFAQFRKWLNSILDPSELQFKDIDMDHLILAMQDPIIRKYWLKSITDKLQAINMEVDNLLAKEDKTRVWETLAIERRTLVRCLTMILDAEQLLESEREAQERQNRTMEMYRGAAAALDLDKRVDNRASDPSDLIRSRR